LLKSADLPFFILPQYHISSLTNSSTLKEHTMNHHDKLDQTKLQPQFSKTWGILLVALLFCLPVYGQVANDECVTATVISSIPFTDIVNTTLATNNPADPRLGCNFDGNQTDGNTVWYVWTPPHDITVNISTDGSTEPDGDPLDTVHGVFTGTCGALTEVACVDVGLTDNLTFAAKGGVTYFIKFGEFLGGVGGGNLVVTVGPIPLFEIESVRDGISPPIGSLVAASALLKQGAGAPTLEEVPMFMKDNGGKDNGGNEGSLEKNGAMMDLLRENSNLQNSLSPADIQLSKVGSGPQLLQIFDGAENDDNANLLGILLAPPDTDGDIGPHHYVQITNLVTTIFDKHGNVLLGPFPNNVFWTGLGGLCESTNRGDPVVLYDEQTNRWLVSQFAFDAGFTQFSLCIACSQTGDPTGSYFQHEFDFSGIAFPDYPKYGFATNAIGVMVNLFIPPFFFFGGTGLGAIDKAEAFSNHPTTMAFFKLGTNEFGFVAGDNDGPVFNNIPPTFATNNGGSGNTIDFWEIHPDFHTPANSTIGEVASIPVAPFDGDLCPAFRERCISQPGSGTGTPPNNITFLEAISDRLMHRLQLRNFGYDKRAVVCHTVDADGNGKAGLRWYEFRNNDHRGWRLRQQNTFSPNGNHRWMGSIAMNTKREIALGYSISSSTTFTSIGVAGQTAVGSGSGILDAGELVVFGGQNVQRQTARWGDYSAMAVDPVDGTFWYTQEFAEPNQVLQPPVNPERFGWATKIAQIQFNGGHGKLTENVAEGETLPDSYALFQNHPNPFNPETEIRFQLPEASHVIVKISNSLGQEIRTLADAPYEAGYHSIRWDGKDHQRNSVSSGIYFYQLQAGEFNQVKKMNLLR
jgi:hypothetical protein